MRTITEESFLSPPKPLIDLKQLLKLAPLSNRTIFSEMWRREKTDFASIVTNIGVPIQYAIYLCVTGGNIERVIEKAVVSQ